MTAADEQTLALLKEQFPDIEWLFDDSYGMLTLQIPAARNIEIIQWLKDDPRTAFAFLTDICGIHIPQDMNKELGVIYHLYNMHENRRIRLKLFVPIGQPHVHSLVKLWPSANWMERETFDFFGIEFTGHPDLRRILNVDDMDYFPLRKQYHLEDPNRTDKEDIFFGR